MWFIPNLKIYKLYVERAKFLQSDFVTQCTMSKWDVIEIPLYWTEYVVQRLYSDLACSPMSKVNNARLTF